VRILAEARGRSATNPNRSHQHPTEEFIVKTQGHITHRSLSLQGRCAFVRAGLCGSNALHFGKSRRPVASLGYEDGMHPGKGGA
jgi:hypothetical protein